MKDTTGQVIIHETDGTDGEYELYFKGSAEDFGFSNQTDGLEAQEAFEHATEVAEETNSEIIWEGYKPSWA